MMFSIVAIMTLLLSTNALNMPQIRTRGLVSRGHSLSLPMSSQSDEASKRMREILAEESNNPVTLDQTAERMKNLTSEDLEDMIAQVEAMPLAQRQQLKSMGMDPDMMLQSMKVMKDNPGVRESAQKMMERMTPEELLEQSRISQERMKDMSKEELESAAKVVNSLSKEQIDEAAKNLAAGVSGEVVDAVIEKDTSSSSEKKTLVPFEGSSEDPAVIDAMYKVAEFMSQPPTGKVTFKAFSSLPVMVALSGSAEEDLSPRELKECWEDGSLGATRVDRDGFERVWNEIVDYFEDDIMEEARKTLTKRRGNVKMTRTSSTSQSSTPPPAAQPPAAQVGANLSSDQIEAVNDQVKNMSDTDVERMLDQMNNMSPAEEARMKAMGVDPTMMKKASGMMKNNPMMRKAAQAMMKNMSSDQMLKMSQEAQKKMSNMSQEEYEKAMEQMNKMK